jgi:hypothetical protein
MNSMTDKKMTMKEAIRKTNLAMVSFYSDLEKRLKRHPIKEYALYVSHRISKCKNAVNLQSQTPIHFLLNSIEANCAYYNDGYSESITWNKFARIINTYHIHDNNQFLLNVIEENPERFLLMIGRQQFELQYQLSIQHIARAWSLFVNNKHTSGLGKLFESKFHISFEQWFHLSFMACVASEQNSTLGFHKELLYRCSFYDVKKPVVDTFYRYISSTVQEIKDYYVGTRDEEERAFHFMIRSIFISSPIIDFEDGTMLAPHTDLIFMGAFQSLLELVKKINNYNKPLSDSFEEHVSKIIGSLNSCPQIYGNREIEKIVKNKTDGKSCDFLIRTENEIILVECKATTYTANMFTDNAILHNNSSGQIAKGLEQLYTTAYDMYSGVFDELSMDKAKPVVGVVVTLGEMPLVNSDWYFNDFIMKRAENKLNYPIFPSPIMKLKPIVMSIDTFENLITILNNTQESVYSLYEKKLKFGYAMTGDWNTYLKSMLESKFTILPVIKENQDKFYQTMRIESTR